MNRNPQIIWQKMPITPLPHFNQKVGSSLNGHPEKFGRNASACRQHGSIIILVQRVSAGAGVSVPI